MAYCIQRTKIISLSTRIKRGIKLGEVHLPQDMSNICRCIPFTTCLLIYTPTEYYIGTPATGYVLVQHLQVYTVYKMFTHIYTHRILYRYISHRICTCPTSVGVYRLQDVYSYIHPQNTIQVHQPQDMYLSNICRCIPFTTCLLRYTPHRAQHFQVHLPQDMSNVSRYDTCQLLPVM